MQWWQYLGVIKGRAESPAGHTSTGYNSTSPRTDSNLHRIFATPVQSMSCILLVCVFIYDEDNRRTRFWGDSNGVTFYLSFEPGAGSSFDASGYRDLLHSLIMIK